MIRLDNLNTSHVILYPKRSFFQEGSSDLNTSHVILYPWTCSMGGMRKGI